MNKKNTKVKGKSKSKNIKKDNKKTKRKKISFINKDNYLYYLFFILLIVVIVLCFLVYKARDKYQKTKGNMVVHVGEKHDSSFLSLNVRELSKEKMYSLKITNYTLNKINKDKVDYSVTIENNSKARLKVWKDMDLNNLMIDQKSTVIRDVGFGNTKKEYHIYHFKILDKNKVKKNDKINIKILEEKQGN